MIKLPALGIYVHLPWCLRKCPYCDFNSYPLPKNAHFASYVTAICEDLAQQLPYVQHRPIISIYFGGGTPTLFAPAYIAKIINFCKDNFTFSDQIEISMEANPATVLIDNLVSFKEAGINRLSVGVQSLHDASLQALGRVHNREMALRAIGEVQKVFANFNLDLMHSLPGQTTAMAMQDLQEVLSFNPPHLSWYQLTIEEDTPFYQHLPCNLPQEDTIEEIVLNGFELLQQHGYQHYEVSAFTKTLPCVHNTNYWQFGDYLAAGAGAHAKITTDQGVWRTDRIPDPLMYMHKVTTAQHLAHQRYVDAQELPFEYFLNRLRLFSDFNLQEFTDYTGLPSTVIADKLQKFKTENLITLDNKVVHMTHQGHLFLNHMLEDFLD